MTDYGKPGDPSGCYFPKEWRERTKTAPADFPDELPPSALKLAMNDNDRLRAENARLREAGQAVLEWSEMSDLLRFNRGFTALRAALKEGGGE